MYAHECGEYDFIFLPQNDDKAAFHKSALQFVALAQKMSAEQKQRLEQRKGIPYAALPPAMQVLLPELTREIRAMYKSKEENLPQEERSPFTEDRVKEFTVQLTTEPYDGFKRYSLDYYIEGVGGTGTSFSSYSEFKKQREDARRAAVERGLPDPEYVTKRYEITNRMARTVPELKQVVSLRLKKVTVTEVLRDLHKRYGIPTLTEREDANPTRADVAVDNLPLAEALDTLAPLYKLEWEWRRMGFLIVRRDGNPVRDPPRYDPRP